MSTATDLFVMDLASRYCEKSTSRKGCFRDGKDDMCDPCAARKVLGADEAPRRCENCNAVVDADGIDGAGGDSCEAPKHIPHRFYEEFGRA